MDWFGIKKRRAQRAADLKRHQDFLADIRKRRAQDIQPSPKTPHKTARSLRDDDITTTHGVYDPRFTVLDGSRTLNSGYDSSGNDSSSSDSSGSFDSGGSDSSSF